MVPRTGEIDQLDPTDDMEDTVEITEVEVRRADIEQTRADIGETLDAIKDKLQPQMLIQQAKDSAQEVTSNVAQKARETVHEVMEQARESAQNVVEQARETVHSAVQEARETVHSAVQEAREAIPEAAHNAVSSAVDTAKEAVGGVVHTAKDAVTNVVDTAKGVSAPVVEHVRENPLPYALIGLGLGWLYMNARRSPSPWRGYQERRHDAEYRPTSEYNRATAEYPYRASDMQSAEAYPNRADNTWSRGETAYRAGYRSGTTYGTAGNDDLDTLRAGNRYDQRSGMSDTVRQAREKVGEKVGDMADAVQDRAGRMVDHVQETMSDYGTRAADQARDMAQGVQHMLEENPLLVGAIALGIGAAVGFMMPDTRVENRMMGDARDRLVENVQQTAHDVVQKVQSVASETLDTAKDKAQDAAAEVLDTAKNEARNQGLMPSDINTPTTGTTNTTSA